MTRNIVATLGLVAMGVGLWLVSPPAALVVVGGILFGCSVYGHLRG